MLTLEPAPLNTRITEKEYFSVGWQRWFPKLTGVLGILFPCFIPGIDTMTYAATISLNPTLANLHKTTTTNAVGNATINAATVGVSGQRMTVLIANDATANRTITFGTSFKPSATIVGTVSKTASICFVSDGANWWELCRTLGL